MDLLAALLLVVPSPTIPDKPRPCRDSVSVVVDLGGHLKSGH
jgi:hypothetical protein